MAYEAIPQMIIGVIIIVVGIRLNINAPVANLIRIALVLIGLVILAFGIFGIFALIEG